MSRTKYRIRYYSIFFFKGEYLTRSASTYPDAVEDLDDVAKQGAQPMGIYDINDWRFDWRLTESIQQDIHYDHVFEITNDLRLKHEESQK